jgi:predicted ATPase with chaperone activity
MRSDASISTLSIPETVQYTDVFRQCSCSSGNVQKYLKRISGPLLDCINLYIEAPDLLLAASGEPGTGRLQGQNGGYLLWRSQT